MFVSTALLKINISSNFKVNFSFSFQPIGIILGSLWRGNRRIFRIEMGSISLHCEEETKMYRQTYKFWFFKKKFKKKMRAFKNIHWNLFIIIKKLFIYLLNVNKWGVKILHLNIFKFPISPKSYEKSDFPWVPLNASLFSIGRFFYGWRKIFTNKNIFTKDDLHVLFITFFSKMYHK